MSFINYIAENIILPASDTVTRQSVSKHLSFLTSSQHWSREQLDEFQNAKLAQLVSHAYNFVPYYKGLFNRLGIQPKEIQNVRDLKKLPILSKATFFKEGIEKFTSTGVLKKDRIQSSSSGSTGEPLYYFTTKDAYSMNIAASLRGWYWMGYRLGDKYVKLSQNPRNISLKKIQDKISRNLYLATNPLIDSNYKFILEEIENYRPKIIRCYPDPLLFLARYKQNHPEYNYKPLALTTTGNTLHPETRLEIEEAFGCNIFDSYNCEGNSTVFECSSHTCYHSTEEYGITEVIDENGNSITSGIGRLISTDLWNFAHPFIRYDTQDIVEVDNIPCSCGKIHLRINKIMGRDNDVLVMENGRKFIVHNFTGFFQSDHPEVKRSVDQFQIVKKESVVTFKLVINNNFTESVIEYIKQFWEAELKLKVEIEIVANIALSKNGKRKFIINE